jgi:hypothetical protein
MSLWSYCNRVPDVNGSPAGYFHRIVALRLVRGPVVATQSRHDTAVGTWYPRAAWAAEQVAFALGEFPKYGAVGSFGVHGGAVRETSATMLPVTASYGFRPGQFYNVDGSQFINVRHGLSGAHSDIQKAEVAHLAWSTMLPT